MTYNGYIYIPAKEEDYVLGGNKLPRKVLRPNSDWSNDVPESETQIKQTETSNCTGFNTATAVETLMFGAGLVAEKPNYSDRGVGIMAGTRPPGNNPKTVADTIRHKGLFAESLLPFSDDIKSSQDYYSPDPLPYALTKEGDNWVEVWDFGYEWAYPSSASLSYKQEALIEALKYSPVCISVYAWYQVGEFYDRPNGEPDTHWTTAIFANKEYILVEDSYPPFKKKVAWDMNPRQAMRYHIDKQMKKVSWWTKYWKSMFA